MENVRDSSLESPVFSNAYHLRMKLVKKSKFNYIGQIRVYKSKTIEFDKYAF